MTKKNFKVAQIDEVGRVKVWDSIYDVCEMLHCSYNNISEAINNKMTTLGCTWKYVTTTEARKLVRDSKGTITKFKHGWTPKSKTDNHGGARKPHMIVQLAKNGKYVGVYKSYYNAEKQTGIENYSIWLAANGKQKFAGGYKWVKVEF